MKIHFLGGVREVGRSCFLLHEGQSRILLDCGVKLGEKEEHPLLGKNDVHSLSHAVLSHAHLDHSGYFPAIYGMGYKRDLYLTKPTRDLIQLLYADYLKLAGEKGTRPFSERDVSKLLASTRIVEFEDGGEFARSGIEFFQSGHILGSSLVKVNQGGRTLLYSGDVNLRETRLLDGATMGVEAHGLILESTYGSKADRHLSSKALAQNFVNLVGDSLRKGGKVLVPSFAIGRGQEVLFTLESFMRSGSLPKVPIYLDGMVKKALRIYRHNAIYLKREVQRRILTSDDDPFKSENYRVPEKKDRSDVLQGGPCVIVATSGMLTGGPAMMYLEKLAPGRENALVLVGYQGEGTLGRKLLEGADEIELKGRNVEVRMNVSQAPLSAHSDHDELVKFAKSVKGLEKVFVVHGEGSKSDELASDIEKQCNRGRPGAHEGKVAAVVPELGEVLEL